MSKCVFAGTFDPFTLGHFDVVKRVSKMFETVYVVVSKNASKNTVIDSQTRYDMVVKACIDEPNVKIVLHEGLLVDFCNDVGANCIVKGVRNSTDFDYERLQASVNKQLGNIETLFLPCSDDMSFLSSSFVRELLSFGKDISKYVPEQIVEEVKKIYSKQK